MKDYNSPIYDEQRETINKYRAIKEPWERILFGRGNNEEDLVSFLENMKLFNCWDISAEDWKNLVQLEKEGEEKRLRISDAEKSSIIGDKDNINDIVIPMSPASCWQKYRRYLIDKQKFLPEDVRSIQDSSYRILQRLNSDTKGKPVKGLVVGNVQSGKTANMAALMAMAADYGWNMFIVLSGTIDNLRRQTQARFNDDFSENEGALKWESIDRPEIGIALDLQKLDFKKNRYFTVCLKNSVRLKRLIKWLHSDPNQTKNMRIIVIDDEADQAGVNTAIIDDNEKKEIYRLITNLVNQRNDDDTLPQEKFGAMNYIGYTATPYANILNDPRPESLYPKNLIQ